MKNMEGLTEAQYKAISMLVWGDYSKQEIADTVGVHRTSLFRWYKNEKFMEELQKERRNKFAVYGDVASKELMKLVKDDSDKRTQLQAIKLVLGENGIGNDKVQLDINQKQEIKITLFDSEDEETEE